MDVEQWERRNKTFDRRSLPCVRARARIYYYFLLGMIRFMNLNLFEGSQRNCRFIPNIMYRSSEMDGKEIDE